MKTTTKSLLLFLLVFSFLTACTPEVQVEPIFIEDSTEGRTTSRGYVAYEEQFVKYTGNFTARIGTPGSPTRVLRIYLDAYNASNATARSIFIMGRDATNGIHRENISLIGMLNGSGCDAEGDATTGCANFTTAFKEVIGFEVYGGASDGAYYDGTAINAIIAFNDTGTTWKTLSLVSRNQTTEVASRVFDGTFDNSLLYNTSVYKSGKFSASSLKETANALLIGRYTCAQDGDFWYAYDYSPDGEVWFTGGSGALNLTVNNSNSTLLSDYAPINLVKVTAINTSSSLTGNNCTLLMKFAGYNT